MPTATVRNRTESEETTGSILNLLNRPSFLEPTSFLEQFQTKLVAFSGHITRHIHSLTIWREDRLMEVSLCGKRHSVGSCPFWHLVNFSLNPK